MQCDAMLTFYFTQFKYAESKNSSRMQIKFPHRIEICLLCKYCFGTSAASLMQRNEYLMFAKFSSVTQWTILLHFDYLHSETDTKIKPNFNCLVNKTIAFSRYLLASSWKWLQGSNDGNRELVPWPRMANNVESIRWIAKLQHSSISIFVLQWMKFTKLFLDILCLLMIKHHKNSYSCDINRDVTQPLNHRKHLTSLPHLMTELLFEIYNTMID